MTATLERRRSTTPAGSNDLPLRDGRHRYSLARAIRDAADHEGRLTGGLEFEISRELERRTGRAPQGFFCPWNAPVEHRNLGFGGSAGYSGLAAAQATVPDVLIDVLRAKLALDRLGAQIKDWTPGTPSGLGVMLPTKASAATVSWVSDGSSAASESNMTVTQAAMQPHTCTAYTDVTRRMMTLGGPSFEKHVIDDLVTGLKIGIDAAAINGVGANGTLLGLFQNSNIPQFVPASDSGDGGVPVWADLVALEETVGTAGGDAPADARIGFLTSPAGRKRFRQVAELASGTATPAWKAHTCRNPETGEWETLETCMGYAAIATYNVPQNLTRGESGTGLTTALLGNFHDLVVNLFTGFDVLVNPYLQSVSGIVRISAFVDVDAIVLHAGSFAILNAIS